MEHAAQTIEERRRWMVQDQLRRRHIRDERVLAAMREIPRELFVPQEYWLQAYDDAPISIGFDQTISQPYMTALMCSALELNGTERVLEVGTGSGLSRRCSCDARARGLLGRDRA